MAIVATGITTNPEIREIALRLFDVCQIGLKRGAQSAIGYGNVKIPAGSLEELASVAFSQEQSKNHNRVMMIAGKSRNAREFFVPLRGQGASSFLSFSSTKSVIEQAADAGQFAGLKLDRTLAGLRPNSFIDADYLQSLLGFMRLHGSSGGSGQQAGAPKAKLLRLKLKSATAVKRYGLELTDWGADDMRVGGDALDSVLPKPTHVKVAPIDIGTYAEDGRTRNFSPDLAFAQFPLAGNDWPRGFFANIFLAESDASGAFLEFLRELWELIGKDVIKIATQIALSAAGALAGAATGAGAGAAAGTLAEPIIGTIIGAVVGALIGFLAAWIMDSLEDDIFVTPGQLFASLASPADRFDGSLRSSTYSQQFTKGSALYTVDYYWELQE